MRSARTYLTRMNSTSGKEGCQAPLWWEPVRTPGFCRTTASGG